MHVGFDFLLKARATPTTSPTTTEPGTISLEPTDNVGLSILTFEDAATIVALPMGTITEGTFLYLNSDIDIELFVGDSAVVTPLFGSFFCYNIITEDNAFDELSVRNNNTAGHTATIKYFVAGDLDT
jgi:hypothetical protein